MKNLLICITTLLLLSCGKQKNESQERTQRITYDTTTVSELRNSIHNVDLFERTIKYSHDKLYIYHFLIKDMCFDITQVYFISDGGYKIQIEFKEVELDTMIYIKTLR